MVNVNINTPNERGKHRRDFQVYVFAIVLARCHQTIKIGQSIATMTYLKKILIRTAVIVAADFPIWIVRRAFKIVEGYPIFTYYKLTQPSKAEN